MLAGSARGVPIYARYGNPAQWAVQQALAALEHAEDALVFSSGSAALAAAMFALVAPGEHVLAARDLYGGSSALLRDEFPATGRSATLVDLRDPLARAAALRPETRVLYCEVLSNPMLRLADLPELVVFAREHGLHLVVDATFVTPLGLRPLEYGADLVIHSASKFLNGHSDVIAGVVAGRAELVARVWPKLVRHGACLDPAGAALLHRGLKTLAVRMRAHRDNLYAVAEALAADARVREVHHPCLPGHPDHALAERLLALPGGVLSFVLEGGEEAAARFCGALRLVREATSLGGVESLVSRPATTSHARLDPKERNALGILPGTVRLSVGIEDPEDLRADLRTALAASV